MRRTSVADVIEDKRTARERVRPRASDDRIVRPINVISVAARERRDMRPANVSIASVVLKPSTSTPQNKVTDLTSAPRVAAGTLSISEALRSESADDDSLPR